MPGVRPYCTFRVDGLWLGVDVLEVQEVIRHRTPTRVPAAPPAIRGLINLRGQIVTVLHQGETTTYLQEERTIIEELMSHHR